MAIVLDTSYLKTDWTPYFLAMKDYATEYDKEQAMYDALAEKLGTLSSAVEGTTKAKGIYDAYNNKLLGASERFGTARNINTIKELGELRRMYGTLIKLLEEAKKIWELELKELQALKQDPYIILSRDAMDSNLDTYLNGTKGYNYVSGSKISQTVAEALKNYAKQYVKAGLWSTTAQGQLLERINQSGLSSQDVLTIMQGGEEARKKFPDIYKIIDGAVLSTGIQNWNNQKALDAAYESAYRGLPFAMVELKIDTQKNAAYLPPYELWKLDREKFWDDYKLAELLALSELENGSPGIDLNGNIVTLKMFETINGIPEVIEGDNSKVAVLQNELNSLNTIKNGDIINRKLKREKKNANNESIRQRIKLLESEKTNYTRKDFEEWDKLLSLSRNGVPGARKKYDEFMKKHPQLSVWTLGSYEALEQRNKNKDADINRLKSLLTKAQYEWVDNPISVIFRKYSQQLGTKDINKIKNHILSEIQKIKPGYKTGLNYMYNMDNANIMTNRLLDNMLIGVEDKADIDVKYISKNNGEKLSDKTDDNTGVSKELKAIYDDSKSKIYINTKKGELYIKSNGNDYKLNTSALSRILVPTSYLQNLAALYNNQKDTLELSGITNLLELLKFIQRKDSARGESQQDILLRNAELQVFFSSMYANNVDILLSPTLSSSDVNIGQTQTSVDKMQAESLKLAEKERKAKIDAYNKIIGRGNRYGIR